MKRGAVEHPLHQIAQSPTHKLLLKQWLKEQDLIAGRAATKEAQIETVRREIAALYCTFFIFHSLILALLFSSASNSPPTALCRRSWLPCLLSLLCSMTIVWAIRYKTDVERHMVTILDREEEDGMLLTRCVGELKRKGVDFDLLKEVDALRRAKSLRVEAKAAATGVRRWSAKDLTTMVFLVLACGFVGLTRYILCH